MRLNSSEQGMEETTPENIVSTSLRLVWAQFKHSYSWYSHLAKWLNWLGARASSKGNQEEIVGSNPGCVLFGTEDFEAVFSPNFLRRHLVSGVAFSHCSRGPTVSLHCTSSKLMTVGEEIRVRNFLPSTRTRELTWNHSGCWAWNRPTGERQAEKKACSQLASEVTTCCNLSRQVFE